MTDKKRSERKGTGKFDVLSLRSHRIAKSSILEERVGVLDLQNHSGWAVLLVHFQSKALTETACSATFVLHSVGPHV